MVISLGLQVKRGGESLIFKKSMCSMSNFEGVTNRMSRGIEASNRVSNFQNSR
jgi:hypothetical protein